MHFNVRGGQVRLTFRNREALLAEIRKRLRAGRGFTLATLNVDHLEKLDHDPAFREAYGAHDLVVADGNPVVWLSRLAGDAVSLVPGSDVVEPLCRVAAEEDVAVAMIAGTRAAADAAASRLCARLPGLRFALLTGAPFPFDPDGPDGDALIEALRESGARLCLLGVGAPRQERFAARAAAALPQVGFASVGAGVDFIAGLQRRAPAVVRRARLEWLWRALSSPRRLVPRYAKGALILPGHAVNALRQRRATRGEGNGNP